MLIKSKAIVTSLGMILVLSSFADVGMGFKTDPYLLSTRTQLRKARAHLFAGDTDKSKSGNRAKAIDYTNEALDELEKAMKANHHHHGQRLAAGLPITTSSAATFQGSHMRKALIHLKQAKENLGAAVPDRGGHSVNVMKLIDKAIVEMEVINANP